MPRLHIRPIDPSFPLTEFIVADEAAVFHMVQRLDCKEADVLRGEEYCFSVRLADNGVWVIFQRSVPDRRGEGISSFG